MGAHVGEATAGVFAVVAEGGEVVVDAARAEDVVVGAGGRGAIPHFPVGPLWGLLVGQVAGNGGATDADADGANLADAAAADVFDGAAEDAAELGALLAAGLEDDVVVAGGADHGPRFGDRQRQR